MLAFPTANPVFVPYMLEDLDTYKINVGGNFSNSAPIGGTFIQGNKKLLQDLGKTVNTYHIKVGGDFTSSAPIGGVFIQGNKKLLQDLDTYVLNVSGDFKNSAPIGGTFIQGNEGKTGGKKGGKRRHLQELYPLNPREVYKKNVLFI